MKLVWGDFINSIRQFHEEFWMKFPFPKKQVTLFSTFHFPPTSGEQGDWYPWEPQWVQPEVIELHPVDRILMEGPIMPFEVVRLKTPTDVSFLVKQVHQLEREWLAEVGFLKPDSQAFLEQKMHELTQQLSSGLKGSSGGGSHLREVK